MQEIVEQIGGYIRGVWRFRWYIHLIAWPMCVAGWLFVNQMPDQYQSEARVLVDTSSALRPLLRGLAVQSSAEDGIQMMTRTLMSRPNLEKVARMTDMDLKIETPEQMDDLVTRLGNTIQFKGGGIGRNSSNIYNISYIDNDPKLAKNTVQALLTLFIESTLGDTRKESNSARKFIEEQVKEYEQRLIDAENRLKEFKRKNAGVMPEDGRSYFSQLAAAKKQLEQAKLELLQTKKLRDEYKRQLEQEKPSFNGAIGAQFNISHPLDGRIESLESRLDELLLKFTQKHPDVTSTQDTIKRLKSTREQDIAELSKDEKQNDGLSQNPVYQQLKIKLGESEAIIASIKPRIEDYTRNVKRLEGLVDIIPQIEADLKNLNRDYNINKKNYDQLLSRRESANLAEQAESSTDDVKFRVIDPPLVPTQPIGPNRPLFASVVLIASLIAGLGFAFFLSQIKPMFDTPRQLQEVIKVPVLGYISRVWTPQEKRRRRLDVISFGVVGICLVVVFTGMLAIEILEIDLLASIKRRI